MTPLKLPAWEAALQAHPDKAFSCLIVKGIREGFRIGFNRACPLRSASRNNPSATKHSSVVSEYLAKELKLGRMLGPFQPGSVSSLPVYQINRFGVIPKGHNTGKWRLITDLSFPPGSSVNDGIEPDLCSLSYTSVEQVAEVAASHGRGALLAKMDVEAAYRLIPVHPQDHPLQAVQWGGAIYIDPMLSFGLRSAPKIFNAVADALEWYVRHQGVQHVFHYLDDFIVVGSPETSECSEAMATLLETCAYLGVPVAEHKLDGPSTCLTFLGIEVDTMVGELRLPTDKLQRLQATLQKWGDRKACGRRQLESLVGLLNHACKVVRSGRSFLRRMLDLLHTVPGHRRYPHPIRLNQDFRSDLAWWQAFATQWNGVSFLAPPAQLPEKEMASDASGLWGCGAWHEDRWFQLKWDDNSQPLQIAVKELLPIVLACELWGPLWTNHRVTCHCDNQVVVAALYKRTCKEKHCMHMLRALAFIEAHHQFVLQPVYINTMHNHLADDLSRDKLFSFLSKVPKARRHPDPLSTPLLTLLLDPQIEAGISRVRMQQGTSAQLRLPITPPLLRRIKQTLDATRHPNSQLLWAIACTAFFGFFRLGELLLESQSAFSQTLHLAWGDVAVDNPQTPKMVRFRLKQSKTDQYGKGVDVVLGRTDTDLCPVAAVLGYFASRGDRPGPLFIGTAGKPLLKKTFVGEIRKILVTLGVPQGQYAGHSFRIGAATTAALAGVEDSTIQLLGRWHSSAFLRYLRTPPDQLARLSSVLAASNEVLS